MPESLSSEAFKFAESCAKAALTAWYEFFIRCELVIPWAGLYSIPRWQKKPMQNPNYRLRLYQNEVKLQQNRATEDPQSEWYQYTPLGERQIRLLHILPESDESKIKCNMEIASLDDENIFFNALSYTWGDPTHAHRIHCADKVLPVTESLWAALQHIRRPSNPQIFWIDAICINQADVAERSAQVRLMDAIYSRAYQVVAWIGPSDEKTDSAFALLNRIHDARNKVPQRLTTVASFSMDDMKEIGLADIEESEWDSLDWLFWRPWFMRIWIVQEITLPRHAYLMCGDKSMHWDVFLYATEFLGLRLKAAARGGFSLSPTFPLRTLRGSQTSGQKIALLPLLSLFRQSLATNPVDKVYALLGLADSHDILPDYSKSYAEVFSTLATHFLQDSLDILMHVQDIECKTDPSIPSWVPDWSAHHQIAPFANRVNPVFNACGGTSHYVRFSPDGKILIVKGILIDRVTRMSSPILGLDRAFRPSVSKNVLSRYIEKQTKVFWLVYSDRAFRGCEVVVDRLKSYHTGEDIRSVRAHLMVAGAAISVPKSGESSHDQEPSPDSQPQQESRHETLDLLEAYAAWRRVYALNDWEQDRLRGEERDTLWPIVTAYQRAVSSAGLGRRVFTTKKGYAGWTSWGTKRGDVVALFEGGKTAYMLREVKTTTAGSKTYQFLGEAYLHGFMNGEGFAKDDKRVEFHLV